MKTSEALFDGIPPNDAIHLPRPLENMQLANNLSLMLLRAGDCRR